MTTQGAGTSAAEKSNPLDVDEAERLASMIRPAWDVGELDEGEIAPAPAAAASALSTDEALRLAEGGSSLSNVPSSGNLAPPRDTVIDGAPSFSVGSTVPEPPPERPAPAQITAPAAPLAAGPTKVGLGEDVAAALAQVDSDARPAEPPPSSRASSRKRSNAVAGPVAGAPNSKVSFSREDDPIEIPVQKASKTMWIVGGVGALAAIGLIAFLTMGGDSKKPESKAEPAKTSEPVKTEPKKVDEPKTAKPAETALATATPAETASAAPSATASATAAPSATATATSQPVAAADPPKKDPPVKKDPPPKPTSTTPPKGGGSKGNGGIIRDTPF